MRCTSKSKHHIANTSSSINTFNEADSGVAALTIFTQDLVGDIDIGSHDVENTLILQKLQLGQNFVLINLNGTILTIVYGKCIDEFELESFLAGFTRSLIAVEAALPIVVVIVAFIVNTNKISSIVSMLGIDIFGATTFIIDFFALLLIACIISISSVLMVILFQKEP